MKYNVGDIVVLHTADILANCDNIGDMPIEYYGGRSLKIIEVYEFCYKLEKGDGWYFYEDMIARKIYPTFSKSDLQNGDFVVLRNGMKQMFIKMEKFDTFICENKGWCDTRHFNNDLTSSNHLYGDDIRDYDIVKVYRPNKQYTCCFNNYTSGNVVYDEKTHKNTTLTIGEIEKMLGIDNLKIVK